MPRQMLRQSLSETALQEHHPRRISTRKTERSSRGITEAPPYQVNLSSSPQPKYRLLAQLLLLSNAFLPSFPREVSYQTCEGDPPRRAGYRVRQVCRQTRGR